MELVVTPMHGSAHDAEVEVVERKGLGHPDTLCDAVAEVASAALVEAYRERFGAVLHHNVDKVLLVGGAAEPSFGGGRVTEPIDVFIAGRAVHELRGATIPVEERVVEAARAWLASHLRDLDVEHDVRFHPRVRPGSGDLVTLFARGETPLCNDTSIGVGFAPATPLERAVRSLDAKLRSSRVREEHPHLGEDLKIMAVRRGRRAGFTVANAFVDRHVPTLADYRERRDALRTLVREHVAASFAGADVEVNAADDLGSGDVYLTVTGTSAESGDDGEAGRGNRYGGLITPMRPMTLESVAGKNPVSHVGKLYNVAADRIARALCERIPEVTEAECLLVSRIGAPVDDPQLTSVQVRLTEGVAPDDVQASVHQVVETELARLDDVEAGEVLAHLVGVGPG